MHRFTLPERLEIIKKYYRNNGSIATVQREFTRELGRVHHFSESGIRRTVQRLEREYTLLDLKPPTRMRSGRSDENIAAVAASVEDDPNLSYRRRAAELGLARETTRQILHLDLGLHPYKIVLTHNCSRKTMDVAVSSPIGLYRCWPMIPILAKKSSFRMRRIFGSAVTSTNKISATGLRTIHNRPKRQSSTRKN